MIDEEEPTWEQREWLESLHAAWVAGVLPEQLLIQFAARIRLGEELYIYRAAGEDGPWNLWAGGMRWVLATVVAAWRESTGVRR